MQHRLLFFPVLIILGAALSGCLGGDDSPESKGGDEPPIVATPTAETGAIEGTVVTDSLEPIAGATASLVRDGGLVADARSGDKGRFVLNGLEPGTYQLQVTAVCCRAAVDTVTVAAGEVTEVGYQLARLTADDLQVPYSDPREWGGMISCAVAGVALCGIQGDFVSELQDPNDRFMTEFSVGKGLKSLVITMKWDPVGSTLGKTLTLLVENDGCGGLGCSYTYAEATGESPIEVRIDNEHISEAEWKWDAIEDNRTMQFRVFPGELTDAMYQQGFTIYYEAFYWQPAPEGYSNNPDG